MNQHFAYLLDEQSDSFFQKVSCQEAERIDKVHVPRPEPEPIEKQASEPTSFEKVASRLDSDLYIMKTAGVCGLNLGMSKRACAYVDRVMDEVDMTEEEFDYFFDKVAADSILVDLATAQQQLHEMVDFDKTAMDAIDRELAFTGFQMSKLAELEKEALLAAGRALFAAGKAGAKSKIWRAGGAAKQGIKNVPGRVSSRAGKMWEGTKAGGRWAKALPGRAARGAGSKYRQARLGLAERNLRNISRASKNPLMKAQTPAGAAYRKSLQGSALKQSAGLQKMMSNPKYQAAAKQRRAARKIKKQKMGTFQDRKKSRVALDEKRKATATRTKMEREQGAGKASEAANLDNIKLGPAGKPKAGAPPKGPKSKGPEPQPGGQPGAGGTPQPAAGAPPAAAGADPKFMDTWKKMSKGGWGNLSAAERGVMVRGGVTGALGYRAVTGKGAVTGGEGLI
jgi:hypothetical protein